MKLLRALKMGLRLSKTVEEYGSTITLLVEYPIVLRQLSEIVRLANQNGSGKSAQENNRMYVSAVWQLRDCIRATKDGTVTQETSGKAG